jgi:predicted enzyme related to lactoylglutathione lyase
MVMTANVRAAVPILPAADLAKSLAWWTKVCGFSEDFRDATPPNYAGISRNGASLHLSRMSDPHFARTVGDQTMVRIVVDDVAAMYAEYQQRGGEVHPNGALQKKPWGTTEFGAIDPNGVCVTFVE